VRDSLSSEEIWQILDEVKDPEIPVVSVVEMGLIRAVGKESKDVIVTMTPTFIGCPALNVMQDEIEERLRAAGAENVVVRTVLSPAWSTDWMTSGAREKLKKFGLAPPPRHGGQIDLALLEAAACPYCGSEETTLKNSFGPTLCRAIFVCNSCTQPFEQFKPI
jgi:ring-1,2-phenylacetyl-CoA epoxidase subunit PaaD